MAKVIIKSLPKKQAGGTTGRTGDQQSSLGLNVGSTVNYNTDVKDGSREDIRSTYPQVDREDANVEIEKGEYVVSPDLGSIYQAGGKKHYAGGTPIKAQEGSYIVSDFIKTNQPIMEALGFDYNPKTDKKQTWAQLLKSKVNPKEYNSFASLLKDKEQGKVVDPYEYNTAKNKLPDHQTTVSKIALGNELTKAIMGKPYNIPGVAQPAMQTLQQPQMSSENADPLFEAKMGGYLPIYQTAGEVNLASVPYVNGNNIQLNPNGPITPYGGDKTWKGNASKYSQDEILSKLDNIGYHGPRNVLDAQRWLMKSPDYNSLVKHYHSNEPASDQYSLPGFGQPNAGHFDDGLWGHRWDAVLDDATKSNNRPVPVTPPTIPPVVPPVVPPTKQPETNTTKAPIDFNSNKANTRVGYDARNIMGILNSMQTPPRQHPWSAGYQPNLINGVYDNPNYFPQQSAYNSRMAATNQTANPTTSRYNLADQTSLINGFEQETQRAHGNNLGIANNVNAQNAQIMNQYNAGEAQRKTSDYDKNVLETDNYYTQKKLAANDFLNQMYGANNNMLQEKFLLASNPQYTISNPNDYGSIVFNKGKSLSDPGTQQQNEADQMLANYTKFKNSGLFNHDQIIDILTKMNKGKQDYTETTKKPGQQGYSTKTRDYSNN